MFLFQNSIMPPEANLLFPKVLNLHPKILGLFQIYWHILRPDEKILTIQ